jgi:hypothetical protein
MYGSVANANLFGNVPKYSGAECAQNCEITSVSHDALRSSTVTGSLECFKKQVRGDPWLSQHWYGNRNNHNGEVGFKFRAVTSLEVSALGRAQSIAGWKLHQSATVTLWSDRTAQPIASVSIGTRSFFENGFFWEGLMFPVTLSAGHYYTISQACSVDMPDLWANTGPTMADLQSSTQTGSATFIQGVWSGSAGVYPNNPGSRLWQIVNFKISVAR